MKLTAKATNYVSEPEKDGKGGWGWSAALRIGAAHYVPKSIFSERAAETVRTVLGIAQEGRKKRRLQDCWTRSEYRFELDNDSALITPLVSQLQKSLANLVAVDQRQALWVGVALHEAIRNAMDHGNLELESRLREVNSDDYYRLAANRRYEEPYSNRRVHVRVCESPGQAEYFIRDEGPGFDIGGCSYDPTNTANLSKPSGRGLFLIRTFMDEVSFNATGNEITMA